MDRLIPMSRLNQTLLLFSIVGAVSSILIQQWLGVTTFPFYLSVLWSISLIVASTWLTCLLLRLTLKANTPMSFEPLNSWLIEKLTSELSICNSHKETNNYAQINETYANGTTMFNSMLEKREINIQETKVQFDVLLKQINENFLETWYNYISEDKAFPDEANVLLKKLMEKFHFHLGKIDKVKLFNKLADVYLVHVKEYRR